MGTVSKYLSHPGHGLSGNLQISSSLDIRMTSPVSQFSARLVRMSRLGQPGAAATNYQVISPIIVNQKAEETKENIVEQKVESVTPLMAVLPPLPSKRWEIQPAVKIPSVNISITDSSQT